jgi:hypothetical protein
MAATACDSETTSDGKAWQLTESEVVVLVLHLCRTKTAPFRDSSTESKPYYMFAM